MILPTRIHLNSAAILSYNRDHLTAQPLRPIWRG